VKGFALFVLPNSGSWWWSPVELVGSRRPEVGRVGNPQGCPSGHPQVSAFSAQSGSPRQRACPQIHRACRPYSGPVAAPAGLVGGVTRRVELARLARAQRLTLEREAVTARQQPIEDGVGDRCIADPRVPVLHRQLECEADAYAEPAGVCSGRFSFSLARVDIPPHLLCSA
jgi:hypothetical protein